MDNDPLYANEIDKLLIIKKVFALLSLIVLFLISLLFWFVKKIKRKIIYMNILYLILIEIGYLISIILPYNYNEPDDNLCLAECLLINFFIHCKYVWCFLMAYTSIMESLFTKTFEDHFILLTFIIIFVLIAIPLLSSLFLFLNKLSGNYGSYCYLPLNTAEMRYYVNRIHLYFTTIKIFFIIITFYCIQRSKRNKKNLKKFSSNHKYLIYPKIICILQTLDLIPNIYKIITINSSSFWIEFFHIIFNCSEGIFIFIIFLRSSLFQLLFSQFYKSIKKKKGKKKRNKKNKKLENLNLIMNDDVNNNSIPLINDKENEEN